MNCYGKQGTPKSDTTNHISLATWSLKVAFGLLQVMMLVFALSSTLIAERKTALDAYVYAPDSHYHYELIQQTEHAGYTFYLLQMTSQKWRSSSEVNRTLWQHWITIYKPSKVTSTTGMLIITGGSNDGHHPNVEPILASIATASHTVVSVLSDVPNQPLTFTNDPHGPRHEDEIIVYTWKKYLETGDATWLARLPMTKAAVRAMDTVTSFMATAKGGKLAVKQFVVAGASKRGWTTWTTAAVDPRVVAIVPMVIDTLNVTPQLIHHYRSYGFWSPAVADYYNMGLFDQSNTPRFRKLLSIVDPYSYRDRYTMPKLIINAAGDQYFLPDSSKFYFKELPGEKYLRYEPNANHSLNGDAYENLTAFYLSIIDNFKRPQFGWKFENNGDIRVTTKDKPIAVNLWQATNPTARDFRLDWVGPIYKSSVLHPAGPDVYVAHVVKPKKGWTAFFIELIYPGPKKNYPFHFTTSVRVLPDIEPYPVPLPGKTRLGADPKPDK